MPGSTTLVLTDPDEFQAAFPGARINLVVTGPGVFRARLTRIGLERVVLLSCDENLPRIAHVSLAPQLACIAFPTREAEPMILDGAIVRTGDLIFWPAGQRFHARTAGTFHWGCILFKPKKLPGISRAVAGSDQKVPEHCWFGRPPRPLIRRMLRLHRQARQVALTVPDLIRRKEIASELEHVLVEAVVNCLGTNGEQSRRSPSCRSHKDIVNRFEDIVQASPGPLICISEVCAAIGISDRTLRACCLQYLGMGPNRYVHLRRLTLARRALLHADPAVSTVREIASRYAFDEPGRFAVVYRRLFGESPSITLHRTGA